MGTRLIIAMGIAIWLFATFSIVAVISCFVFSCVLYCVLVKREVFALGLFANNKEIEAFKKAKKMGVSKSLYSFILQSPHISEIQRILKFTAVIIAIAIWIFITFSIVAAVLWLVFFGFVIFIGAVDIKDFKTNNKIKIDVIREKLAIKIANDPCKITRQIGIEPDVSLMSKRELKMVIALYFLHQKSGNQQLLMKTIKTRNIYSYIFDYFYESFYNTFIDDGYMFNINLRERSKLTKEMLDIDDIYSITENIANEIINIIDNINNEYEQFVNFAKKIDPEYKIIDNIAHYYYTDVDDFSYYITKYAYINKDRNGVQCLFIARNELIWKLIQGTIEGAKCEHIIFIIDKEIERVLSKDIYDNMWKPLLTDYKNMNMLLESYATAEMLGGYQKWNSSIVQGIAAVKDIDIAHAKGIWLGHVKKFIGKIIKSIDKNIEFATDYDKEERDAPYKFLTKFLSPEASIQLDKLIIKSFSDAESIEAHSRDFLFDECIAYNYPEIYRKIKRIDFKTDYGKKFKNYISQMADTYQNDYLRAIIFKYLLRGSDDYAGIPIGKERDILKDILSTWSKTRHQYFDMYEYQQTIKLMDKMLLDAVLIE